ncbi:MAG: hypothetical protein WBZ05_15965 [Desulfobacterales bacterium]
MVVHLISLDSRSSSIHTSMIVPGDPGVKVISRFDFNEHGNIWHETKLELDRTSPNQVIVDASEIENDVGSGTECFGGSRVSGHRRHTY